MSTDSFACRSSNFRNPYSPSSGERRRQWLRQRGLLSPHNGPSRRLANLLPRKHASPPTSSRKTPAHQHSSAHIHLEVDQNSIPVVVAKPLKLDDDDDDIHPPATRTVSMPTEDSARLRAGPFRSRSNHRRWIPKDQHPVPSPQQSRSRRFLNRLKRRSRELPPHDIRARASIDVPRARDRDVDRVSLHRHSLDRRRNPTTHTTSRPRARAVYTVFDKELPRHVLEGDSRFEKSSWNDYRDHIDELAEDTKFMDYLTAPVQRRPPLKPESGPSNPEARNLAVNKLYPLAFIRLLEAHAKYDAESCETCDPGDEEHRYDDVERDDEARVERTVSNGMYDFGRFRTVGGTNRPCFDSKPVEPQAVYNMPKLLDGRKSVDTSPYPSRLFSRISRDSETTSVPVC